MAVIWSRRAPARYGDVADTMAQTAARQGAARARSRHAEAPCGSERCGSEGSGKRGRVAHYLCPYARARGADRAAAAAAAASTAVADSVLANSGSGRTLEPPLVRSAPVERRRGTGTSPTRWPKPQHGKGALELARATLRLRAALNAAALKDQGKGAALPIIFALTRRREAPAEPQLPPRRRRPLSPIPF